MQLWRLEFEMDGINSGTWYHCLPITIMRGRLYISSVRSCKLHGSGTCPVRKDNEVALLQAEMRMVTWMYDVKVKDGIPSKEFR